MYTQLFISDVSSLSKQGQIHGALGAHIPFFNKLPINQSILDGESPCTCFIRALFMGFDSPPPPPLIVIKRNKRVIVKQKLCFTKKRLQNCLLVMSAVYINKVGAYLRGLRGLHTPFCPIILKRTLNWVKSLKM